MASPHHSFCRPCTIMQKAFCILSTFPWPTIRWERSSFAIDYPTDADQGGLSLLASGTGGRLTVGDSREQLRPLLSRLGQIDLFFHDSAHSYNVMLLEYNAAWSHLRQGGVLVSDDIDSSIAFRDFLSHVSTDASSILLGRLGGIRKRDSTALESQPS